MLILLGNVSYFLFLEYPFAVVEKYGANACTTDNIENSTNTTFFMLFGTIKRGANSLASAQTMTIDKLGGVENKTEDTEEVSYLDGQFDSGVHILTPSSRTPLVIPYEDLLHDKAGTS